MPGVATVVVKITHNLQLQVFIMWNWEELSDKEVETDDTLGSDDDDDAIDYRGAHSVPLQSMMMLRREMILMIQVQV